MAPPGEIDIVQKCIGECGLFQVYVCTLALLSKFPGAWHQFNYIFMAAPSPYECTDDPATNVTDGCPCEKPVYNLGPYKSTIISEWNLICNKKFLVGLVQSLFQFGVLVGSFLFGMAADRFGRKKVICVATVLNVSSGIMVSFIRKFWPFTIVRVLNGMSVGGLIVVAFVLVMETVAARHRPTLSAVAHIPFCLGHLSMAGFGYMFRDFRDLILYTSVPVCLLLCYFCMLPESALWLMSTNRPGKAVKILERAARLNSRPTDNIKSDVEAYRRAHNIGSESKKGTFADLFRTPNIRRNSLCMSITYLSCSYGYYGLSQYMVHLSGNAYLNVTISASVTMVGTILVIPLLWFFKRKYIVIGLNVLSTTCLFLMPLLKHIRVMEVLLPSVGVAGNFAIFSVVFLWCTELFPTVIRSNALGFCSVMARVGSILAPFTPGTKTIATWLPPILFGTMPIISTVMCLFVPDTKGCGNMSTIEEGENFGKKK